MFRKMRLQHLVHIGGDSRFAALDNAAGFSDRIDIFRAYAHGFGTFEWSLVGQDIPQEVNIVRRLYPDFDFFFGGACPDGFPVAYSLADKWYGYSSQYHQHDAQHNQIVWHNKRIFSGL